jgi:hypothetical protein
MKTKDTITIQRSIASINNCFSISINGEIVRDFLPTHDLAVRCANFVAKNEGIDTIKDVSIASTWVGVSQYFAD